MNDEPKSEPKFKAREAKDMASETPSTSRAPKKRYYRKNKTVVKDGLWPWSDAQLWGKKDKLCVSVNEVLRRLPPPAYNELIKVAPQIFWLIIYKNAPACITFNFIKMPADACTTRATITLIEPDIIWQKSFMPILIVAHELAHLFDDNLEGCADETVRMEMEIDAFRLVFFWGFQYEIEKALQSKSFHSEALNRFYYWYMQEFDVPDDDYDDVWKRALDNAAARKIGNWAHLTEEEWKLLVEGRKHER